MNDVTWFGGAYLALAILGSLWAIGQVDEPREPRTFTEVSIGIVVQALIIWGLFTVGVTS